VVTGNAIGLATNVCVGATWIGNRVTGNGTGARIDWADTIRRNVITGNAGDGLVVRTADATSVVHRNDLRGNGGTDCVLLEGDRPAGWYANLGLDASPAGLCSPSGR
jgi:hypothetical protein